MARTELTVQEIDRTGVIPSFVSGDATDNHSFDNVSQNVFVYIKNGGGVGITATFITSQTIDDQAVADLAVSIAAGVDKVVGPFRNDLYGQADADNSIAQAVLIDLDTDATVTLGAFELGDVNF